MLGVVGRELVYPLITCPSLQPHLRPPLIAFARINVGCAAIVTPKVRGQSDRLQEPLRRVNSPVQKTQTHIRIIE